jgi:Transcription factor WhiB.
MNVWVRCTTAVSVPVSVRQYSYSPVNFHKAACQGESETMFPEDEEDVEQTASGLALCAICPLRARCEEYFYSFEDHERMPGIWFGTTFKGRGGIVDAED